MPTYYQRIGMSRGLLNGYRYVLDAIDAFVVKGRLKDAAEARAVLDVMWRDYDALGIRASQEATAAIRRRIRGTAVRPPTSGRLESGIVSRPIPTTLPAGAIGIADLDFLTNQAVNPRAKRAGTYWRAQEYGTTAHVGRIVPGYFQPGQSVPDASEFRNHPYFEQAGKSRSGKARKGTPAMVIQRPIEARHFLEDGTTDLLAWHAKERTAINRRAASRLAAI